jgi:hypothetical protein
MKLKLNEPIFDKSSMCEISEIELSAHRVGTVIGFPNDPSDKFPRSKYRVSVKILCKMGDKTKSFPFYASHADFEAGKKNLSADDLAGAFVCILDDAIVGMSSYSDFLYEFGYEDEPKRAKRIYNECARMRHKMEELGLVEDDTLYELLNAIDEKNFEIQK